VDNGSEFDRLSWAGSVIAGTNLYLDSWGAWVIKTKIFHQSLLPDFIYVS
jgi:hypothetical protein